MYTKYGCKNGNPYQAGTEEYVRKIAGMQFDMPTSWGHGRGMASRVGDIAAGLGCRKTLLLTDPFLLEQQIIAPVVKSLGDKGIDFVVCVGVMAELTLGFFESLVDTLDLQSFDAIVAGGGGKIRSLLF